MRDEPLWMNALEFLARLGAAVGFAAGLCPLSWRGRLWAGARAAGELENWWGLDQSWGASTMGQHVDDMVGWARDVDDGAEAARDLLAQLVSATSQVVVGNRAFCPCCDEGTYGAVYVGTPREAHVPTCALLQAREALGLAPRERAMRVAPHLFRGPLETPGKAG